ncbi:hypothetical protein BD309DRAFT_855433 [Dichomitus squalens]|uniref:Uncharacterized protein n=1 Tax=Dichomitus squalens TaxID=114155 RepID=A0A4Q9N3T2_9APHY|nr:hypothetical protein BD311DRAFT_651605 [Dichomitus squalens]TBU47637.1 hypothetical protein BD309DRAFT_855433 [Dichomitus squalens]
MTRLFPTEIEENLLDLLSDHPQTLRNCALTCRRWLPRSRFHLLRAVSLRTREDLASLCGFLDVDPQCRQWVRSVVMAPIVEKDTQLVLETFPVPSLAALPNLRRWEIRGADMSDPSRRRALLCHKATLARLGY